MSIIYCLYILQVQAVSNFESKTGVATTMRHALSARSNRSDMEVYFPSRDKLRQKKVVLSTLVTSGRSVYLLFIYFFIHNIKELENLKT